MLKLELEDADYSDDGDVTEVSFTLLGDAIHVRYHCNNDYLTDDFYAFNGCFFGGLKACSLELEVLSDFIKNELADYVMFHHGNNCSDGEKDYDSSFKSDSWQLRALVAMNGMYLKELSKDSHPIVRLKVVERLVFESKNEVLDFPPIDIWDIGGDDCYEEKMDDYKYLYKINKNLGDISYIDELAYDPDVDVRYELASLALTKHLDVLVADPSHLVRFMVARRGNSNHLELLLNDENEKVRCLVASNQNALPHQLDYLASDERESVQMAIALRGQSMAILTNSKFFNIRWLVVHNGFSHRLLINDPSEVVRMSIAEKTDDLDILDILIEDKNEQVSTHALKRKSNLAQT